jgi:hypothetical protein
MIANTAKRFQSHKFVSNINVATTHEQNIAILSQHIHQVPDSHQWETISASYDVEQLQIHHNRVPSDYTQAIREAHTAPSIDSYYIEKYGWTSHTVNNIMWKQHGKALIILPKRMCKTITQFNHNWLPVNASYSKNATGTGRLCPFCTTCDEDQHHFLSCTHPLLTDQWKEATVTIKAKLTTYDKHVHHHLIQQIGLAVTNWRTTSRPTFLHPQFQQLFHAQSKIGWDHILKGRFSKRWRHHLQQDRERCLQWITFTIRKIWSQLYSVWKTRCQRQHGLTDEDETKRSLLYLTPKVHELYENEKDLQQTEHYMFETPIDELLTKPIPTIKAWVHKVNLRIKTLKDKAKVKVDKKIKNHTAPSILP